MVCDLRTRSNKEVLASSRWGDAKVLVSFFIAENNPGRQTKRLASSCYHATYIENEARQTV